MQSFYLVIRAGPFLHHAVDMHALCEYYDLCGLNLRPLDHKATLPIITGCSVVHAQQEFQHFRSDNCQLALV